MRKLAASQSSSEKTYYGGKIITMSIIKPFGLLMVDVKPG
jgi:hypothetical protein